MKKLVVCFGLLMCSFICYPQTENPAVNSGFEDNFTSDNGWYAAYPDYCKTDLFVEDGGSLRITRAVVKSNPRTMYKPKAQHFGLVYNPKELDLSKDLKIETKILFKGMHEQYGFFFNYRNDKNFDCFILNHGKPEIYTIVNGERINVFTDKGKKWKAPFQRFVEMGKLGGFRSEATLTLIKTDNKYSFYVNDKIVVADQIMPAQTTSTALGNKLGVYVPIPKESRRLAMLWVDYFSFREQ